MAAAGVAGGDGIKSCTKGEASRRRLSGVSAIVGVRVTPVPGLH